MKAIISGRHDFKRCYEVPNTQLNLLGHPLWRSWDLALDSIMTELSLRKIRPTRPALHGQISTFFSDQLTEFKVNLTQYGKYDKVESRQLPVLIQVGRWYKVYYLLLW